MAGCYPLTHQLTVLTIGCFFSCRWRCLECADVVAVPLGTPPLANVVVSSISVLCYILYQHYK